MSRAGGDKGQIAPGTERLERAESIACRVDQKIQNNHLGQSTVKCELLTGTCPVCAVKIAQKWGKFSTAEIAGLKDKADLVAQVQTKHGIERAQAQRDVDAFAKGRQL